jgi:hypothetical protein
MNMILRTLWLWNVVLLGALPSIKAADEAWKPLFNGKDLTGWESYLGKPLATSEVPGFEKDAKGAYTQPLGLNNDPLHVFTVAKIGGEPAIHVSGEVVGTLTTLEAYSDYHLKFQFKWGTKKWGNSQKPRNGGFLYHAHGPEGAVSGNWMHSHQFQVQEGSCGEYISDGDAVMDVRAKQIGPQKYVYDPAAESLSFYLKSPNGVRCGKAGDYEKPSGEWNTFELISLGSSVVHVVNGHVVLRATHSRQTVGDATKPLTGGQFQIQVEGCEMDFKDFQIQKIASLPTEFAEH